MLWAEKSRIQLPGCGRSRTEKILVKMNLERQNRDASIELLRYICSIGIVWFHLGAPFSWIGHSALAVFCILSILYAVKGDLKGNYRKSPWLNLKVIKLWVFWSLIYAALKIIQGINSNNGIASEFHMWMIFTGPSLPLWYFPFIYVASSLSILYFRTISSQRPLSEGAILSVGIVICILLLSARPGVPFAQWSLGVAAVLLAISICRVFLDGSRVQLFFVITVLLAISAAGFFETGRMFILASIVCIIFLNIKISKFENFLTFLGGLSLGVFVLHSGVYSALSLVVNFSNSYIFVFVVVSISTAISIFLKNLPVFRNYI